MSIASEKSTPLKFTRAAGTAQTIFSALIVAALAITSLSGCGPQKSMDSPALDRATKKWAHGKISNIDFSRLKLSDKNGTVLDQSILQKDTAFAS